MPDLAHRPVQTCWECGCSLGVPAPPAGVECQACELRCPACGHEQIRVVWIADAPAAERIMVRRAR